MQYPEVLQLVLLFHQILKARHIRGIKLHCLHVDAVCLHPQYDIFQRLLLFFLRLQLSDLRVKEGRSFPVLLFLRKMIQYLRRIQPSILMLLIEQLRYRPVDPFCKIIGAYVSADLRPRSSR